jgi:antitoxin component of MazEF toxin-antitoxin module
MQVRIKQWGNSKGIVLPAEIVAKNDLKTGDAVELVLVKKKNISGFGIAKGAKPFVREDRLDREY